MNDRPKHLTVARRARFMRNPRSLFSICLILAALPALSPLSSVRAGSEQDPEHLGAAEGTVPVAPTGLFDDSATFVAPENLPIVDVYAKELALLTQAELAEQMEALSITPEGETESLPVTTEEVKMMLQILDELDPGFDVDAEISEELGGSDLVLGEQTAESVIGPDTRRRVTATTRYPFRTVGRIDIGCTGTLIGPRHVLTAGHCVYNIGNDKWYSKLSFTPGQNGAAKPYGTIGWKRAITVRGWAKDHKRDYDYAMIVLKQDVGTKVGWMCYGWRDPMPKYNININGYPGDKPFGTMWHSYCRLQLIRPRRLYYACDTYGGMSGSGVYVYWPSQKKRIIYGIHAYGVDSTGYNGATRITKSVFDNLKKWKATY